MQIPTDDTTGLPPESSPSLPPRRYDNPYYEAYLSIAAHEASCAHCRPGRTDPRLLPQPEADGLCADQPTKWSELRSRYAFPVLDDAAIDAIAAAAQATGRLVEMGAGTGYNCRLLSGAGLETEAFDLYPPEQGENRHHARTHFPVQRGGPEVLEAYDNHALLLSWPPHRSEMALRCLKSYRGEALIYIGEPAGGCTASESFFAELARTWCRQRIINIPNFDGLHDRVEIYARATPLSKPTTTSMTGAEILG